jgi:discoidin domain receptor family protein 2
MPGNSNTYVANLNELTPPIVASKVRFVPHSNHKRTVCMRVEVFGCLYEDGIVSYSSPPGDEFAPNFYLEDVYDGDEEAGSDLVGPRLVNGLGALSDGLYGGNVSLLSGLSASGKFFFI